MNTVATGLPLPAYKTVVANDISSSNPTVAEDYESMIVKVFNAGCTDVDLGYGMWEITDGSGSCNIHNSASYSYPPTLNTAYNVSGVLNFSFDKFKVELRNADDVEVGSDLNSPTITSASTPTSGIVSVVFSENITGLSIEDISNYSINNGVVIVSATQHAFQHSKVNLSVQNISSGVYTLIVNGCEYAAGNMVNDTLNFTSTIENVSINEIDNTSIRIWSNSSKIYVNGIEENTKIEIINVNGKMVYANEISNDIVVNTVPGMYFVKVKINSITKVVKQQVN